MSEFEKLVSIDILTGFGKNASENYITKTAFEERRISVIYIYIYAGRPYFTVNLAFFLYFPLTFFYLLFEIFE